jgi:hypothetical protein
MTTVTANPPAPAAEQERHRLTAACAGPGHQEGQGQCDNLPAAHPDRRLGARS